MASKIVFLLGFIALAAAQNANIDVQYGEIPKYSFSYSVQDPSTGDQKSQEEVREGDNVRGFYTLIEPDGTLRRVDYVADEENGFRATVSRQAGAASPIQHQAHRTVLVQQQAPAIRLVQRPTVQLVQQAPAVRLVQQAPRLTTTRIVQQAPVQTRIITQPITSQLVSTPQYVSTTPQLVTAIPQYVASRGVSGHILV